MGIRQGLLALGSAALSLVLTSCAMDKATGTSWMRSLEREHRVDFRGKFKEAEVADNEYLLKRMRQIAPTSPSELDLIIQHHKFKPKEECVGQARINRSWDDFNKLAREGERSGDYALVVRTENRFRYRNVLAHELGHLLLSQKAGTKAWLHLFMDYRRLNELIPHEDVVKTFLEPYEVQVYEPPRHSSSSSFGSGSSFDRGGWVTETRYRRVKYTTPLGFVSEYGRESWEDDKNPKEDMADDIREILLERDAPEDDAFLRAKFALIRKFLDESYK